MKRLASGPVAPNRADDPSPPPHSLKAIRAHQHRQDHFAIERMSPIARHDRVAAQAPGARSTTGVVTGSEPPTWRWSPARSARAAQGALLGATEAMPLDVPVGVPRHRRDPGGDRTSTAATSHQPHPPRPRAVGTLLLGAATMAPVIRTLVPADHPSAALLGADLFGIEEDLAPAAPHRHQSPSPPLQVRHRRTAPPRARRRCRGSRGAQPAHAQCLVDMYQNGDVDFLVATDAIGMGLNLDVKHVAFADDTKFDGHQTRLLTPAEFGQIAGRAGRHMHNGTFGVTGNAEEFDEELVQRLESHDLSCEGAAVAQPRARIFLDRCAGREPRRRPGAPQPDPGAGGDGPARAEFLARNEAGRLATTPEAVRLLWDCCSIPDYRDISLAQHGEIVTRVFTDLMRHGSVGADWIAEQVSFCDNSSGDIDTLSNRIRQIRTWTFVANRRNFEEADVNMLLQLFNMYEAESLRLNEKGLVLPAMTTPSSAPTFSTCWTHGGPSASRSAPTTSPGCATWRGWWRTPTRRSGKRWDIQCPQMGRK